jgi:DNA-binding NarL/FixJ family response regulator
MTSTAFKSVAEIAQAIDDLLVENAELRQQIAAGSTSSQRSNKKKLTKRDVEMMRQLKRLGASNQELAAAYDVHHATVSRTVRGIYWK